jgi:hypothetical protein
MKPIIPLVVLVLCPVAVAQQQPRYFTPIATKNQMLVGPVAANQGAVGLDASKGTGGFQLTTVMPGGPAEKAGLRVGDVLIEIDAKPLADLHQVNFYETLVKNPGEVLQVKYMRNGQEAAARVPVEARAKVYPDEAKMPPAIAQPAFGGRANVHVAVAQAPDQPQSIVVWILLANKDAGMLSVDDAKFFVLDSQGQQLQRLALDEVRYSIQLWVAQNWRGGNYPPPTPPPPTRKYTITGSETGTYNITQLGNFGTVTGTSTGTYTVAQEPDYNQLGYMLGYSIGRAIRQRQDRKHNEKLVQQGQQALGQWEANYFKSQAPVIPGENRTGGIMYWTGSQRTVSGPLKVILFLANPETKTEEVLTFQFR